MASLYRKYRPRTFAELVGQDSVITAIANALIGQTTVHAYLFAGPRGSGKTSLARLVAKALNCPNRGKAQGALRTLAAADPCNECEICRACDEGRLLDMIEIDAASNRGIDNMRDIRQQVAYAPSMARHKVYIIDEVHMLSKDAANAFLKTLEEPPPFVVFILATTEVHKLLPTVVSRCQRYDFRKIEFGASLARLKDVVSREGLLVTDDALRFVVARGDGSLRDMLGLLDQVVSFGASGQTIDREACLAALGMVGEDVLMTIVEATRGSDPGAVLALLDRCSRQGIDASVLAAQLLEHLRSLLYVATGHSGLLAAGAEPAWVERMKAQSAGLGVSGILERLEQVSESSTGLRGATLPYFTLELALLRGARRAAADLASRVEKLEQRMTDGMVDGSRPAPRIAPPTALPVPVVLEPRPAAVGVVSSPAPAPEPAPAPAPAAALAPAAASGPAAPVTPPAVMAPAGPPTAVAPPAPPARTRAKRETGSGERAPASVAAAPVAAPAAVTPPVVVPAVVEPPRPVAAPPSTAPVSQQEEPDLADNEDQPEPEEPIVAGEPGTADELGGGWDRVMNRIRAISLRTHALLKEVVSRTMTGGGRRERQLKLVLSRGHRFAVERLREESHMAVIRDALDKELGLKVAVSVDEDRTEGPKGTDGEPVATGAPALEKGWAEKQAVSSKSVQTVITQLDAEILRVE